MQLIPRGDTPRVLLYATDGGGAPLTGLTVAAKVSKDGGGFIASSNVVQETGYGFYYVDLTSAETNAAVIAIVATATNAFFGPVVLNTEPNYTPARSARLDNLDATVSNRATQASVDALGSPLQASAYTAPDNPRIAAIDAKTSNLPAIPAARGDAMTLTPAYDAAKTAAQVSDIPTPTANAIAVWEEPTASHQAAGTAGKAITAGTAPTVPEIVSGILDEALASHTTAGTVGKRLADTALITDIPTAAQITDSVWDEPKADHQIAGSTGQQLSTSTAPTVQQIVDGVLDGPIAGHVGAGTVGEAISATGSSTVYQFTGGGEMVNPIITSVMAPNRHTVTVVFSEPVKMTADPDGALNLANYSIVGLTINSVTEVNSTTVTLHTDLQVPGLGYSLTVLNIVDLNGNPL